MNGRANGAARASLVVSLLAELASATGLLMPEIYRDNALVSSAWHGNDLVTLVLAAPTLAFLSLGGAQPTRARELVRLGLLDYMLYNYAFYLFGAAFNSLFFVYAAIVSCSAIALVGGFVHLDLARVSRHFQSAAPVRLVGAYLILLGSALASVYLIQWIAFMASGRVPATVAATGHPTSVVFALDLTLVVPPSLLAGVWLWQCRPWGYALAVVTSVKSVFYMVALSAATLAAWKTGALTSLSQLPLWTAIAVASSLACVALLGRGTEAVDGHGGISSEGEAAVLGTGAPSR